MMNQGKYVDSKKIKKREILLVDWKTIENEIADWMDT